MLAVQVGVRRDECLRQGRLSKIGVRGDAQGTARSVAFVVADRDVGVHETFQEAADFFVLLPLYGQGQFGRSSVSEMPDDCQQLLVFCHRGLLAVSPRHCGARRLVPISSVNADSVRGHV